MLSMLNSGKEKYVIRDNVVDPTGQSSSKGTEVGYDITKNAIGTPHIWCPWLQRESVPEVYAEAELLMVHMYCPECAGSLSIWSNKKEIRFERNAAGGRISIGEFRCTYPGCTFHAKVRNNLFERV